VEKAQNELALARQKLEILRNQTYQRQKTEFDANIAALKVDLSNQEESLKIEQDLLVEIKDQITKCTITVPEGISGQVVYANKYNRRGAEWVLEEGAMVRERQVLIRLPNPDKMQVRATVNESQIASVKVGQPVKIKVDALNSSDALQGKVVKVNQYAEPDGWGGGGIRKYAVFIEIQSPPESIRPGMNASVDILVERQEEVTQIPLQCLYEFEKQYYCIVNEGESFVTREVQVGSTNEKVALITSGVEEGEQLVMAPRQHPDLLDIPGLEEDDS
jgi:HlyD family secretion protein